MYIVRKQNIEELQLILEEVARARMHSIVSITTKDFKVDYEEARIGVRGRKLTLDKADFGKLKIYLEECIKRRFVPWVAIYAANPIMEV